MNTVCLIGRITRDLELKYSQSNIAICKFSIAVNRKTKGKEADFINCIAFGNTAEFINSYFGKGRAIAITGRIQTGSYTNKEGNKIYTTDVICDSVDFADSKRESGQTQQAPQAQEIPNDSIYNLGEDDEDLPF